MTIKEKLTFTEKFIDLQQTFTAKKTENNDFGGYKYRNIEVMLKELKPLLKKHGLYITFNEQLINVGDRYYVQATAIITDGDKSESVSSFAREEFEKKKSDASQLTGSASTYARKYALCGLLGADDGSNDPDGKDNDRSNYTKKEYKKPVVATELATQKQRNLITEKLGDIGFNTNEEIQHYLSSEYGINGKLSKDDASMVINDLLNGEVENED